MKFFLDTYALIEIMEGNQKFQKYLDSDAVTLKDNLAELYFYLLRVYDEKFANLSLAKFSGIVVEYQLEIIPKSMKFKYIRKKTKFSYIDCLGYIYALENKRFFLTGDRAFKGMENVELVR